MALPMANESSMLALTRSPGWEWENGTKKDRGCEPILVLYPRSPWP